MKLMIFIDHSNFFKSICKFKKTKNEDRVIDYHKLNQFVLEYLSKNPQYKNQNLFHVRTYYYDGEYTDNLINKIKQHTESIPETNYQELSRINRELQKAERRMTSQKREMERLSSHYFLETKLKPLQYSRKNAVFQKGVDVQLAVDLVSNAYLNNYDIAVLFSGDIDLYESVKLVKTLGKQVIIFSHNHLMAKGMVKICDFYKDFHRLEDDQLNKFTHIFQNHQRGFNAC